MDVHTNNWRYRRPHCELIIPTVIPEAVFYPYEWGSLSEVFEVKFQTIFYQTQTASKWTKMWARRLSHTHSVGNLTQGIATSFPIFLENNIWHPFNILIMKLSRPCGAIKFIRFFYLTIVNGYIKASSLPETDSSRQEINQEQDIFSEILKDTQQTTYRHDAKSILNLLLQSTKPMECRHLSHYALESTSDLRGQMRKVEHHNKDRIPKTAYPQALPMIRFGNVFTNESLVSIPTLHCFTRNRIWICSYDKCDLGLVSYLDMISEQQLKAIDPLLLVKAEADCFYRWVWSFVQSLEKECEDKRYGFAQNIPIFIENTSHTLGAVADHFYEACVTITGLYNENSGLIKAALSRMNHQEDYWLDVIGVWEQRHSHWGIRLKLKCEKIEGKDISLDSLICCTEGDEEFVESLSSSHSCVGILYSSSLVSWLILPGGFAIKGYFDLSVRDMKYLVERYGG
ncbi:viral DNA cleavage/packaging protein [Porcine lymphotropic herpesvirus 3]|uniref:Viral DNA cleavage/packaging protein n=1 Tax=Suid gammaherpesvirus 5 TaxID=1960251 RepID=Q8B3Z0_9GAMA|nr:viral DNA cleavage/packaging protein [Porcine lymphotropic herpesvirus 3]AAO12334.1 viral DNA cleavage/packaging protein [Porcine lymphotropic herpesvirus 3]